MLSVRPGVVSGILVFLTGCGPSVSPHADVLPSDPNYPKLNPSPVHRVMISGTLPENLPVRLGAYYATSHPTKGEFDHDEYRGCYRQSIAGPTNLHWTESLQLIRRGTRYEAWVTVDKYQPGFCGWVLSYVGYQVLNTFQYWARANTPESPVGDGILSTFDQSPPGQLPWQGPINVWCRHNPDLAARHKDFPEQCRRFTELGPVGVPGVPASERGAERTIWVSPETHSVTINFHDLDAERAAGEARE